MAAFPEASVGSAVGSLVLLFLYSSEYCPVLLRIAFLTDVALNEAPRRDRETLVNSWKEFH
jgi:hypothetical protein